MFLTASALAGQATVKAAKDLDFHPQWVTIGDNVTDTEAHFYEPVKDEYDGAYGINTVFDDPTPAAVACNRIARQRAGVSFPKGSDGYGFTAVTCLQVQVLVQGDHLDSRQDHASHVDRRTRGDARGADCPWSDRQLRTGQTRLGQLRVRVARITRSTGKFTPVGGGHPKPVKVQ